MLWKLEDALRMLRTQAGNEDHAEDCFCKYCYVAFQIQSVIDDIRSAMFPRDNPTGLSHYTFGQARMYLNMKEEEIETLIDTKILPVEMHWGVEMIPIWALINYKEEYRL